MRKRQGRVGARVSQYDLERSIIYGTDRSHEGVAGIPGRRNVSGRQRSAVTVGGTGDHDEIHVPQVGTIARDPDGRVGVVPSSDLVVPDLEPRPAVMDRRRSLAAVPGGLLDLGLRADRDGQRVQQPTQS